MHEIAEMLTWTRATETPASWRGRYEDLLTARIKVVAAANDEGLCILESLAMLPRDRQRAFVRAPQIASRILAAQQPGELDCGPVARALLAELAAAGIATELSEPVWTALGDRCLDPAAPEAWRDARFGVHGTPIVMDGAGPVDFSTEATGALVLPTPDQRTIVEDRLGDAARTIARASASTFAFWTECVDVVAIRTAAAPSTPMSSNSFLRNARLMLILNGHRGAAQSASLADAIVHEAIHSLLFMYEELHAPFVPRNSRAEFLTARSPWSGKDLFLSAYLHACIVWYGLYWFWTAAAASSAWPTRHCDALCARARAGFADRPFGNLGSDARRAVAPPVAGLLDELERRVLAA